MLRHVWSVLMGGLMCLTPADSSPQDKKPAPIKGWGTFVDPDGDCQIKLDQEKLIITVPGNTHDLSAELNKVSAPRVLRDIEGDFIAQVIVSGTVHPGSTSTVATRLPFNGAGILLWQDDKNYVRLERAGIMQGNQFVPYALFEARKNGRPLISPSFKIADRDTYVRLERRGGKMHGCMSADGIQWQSFQPLAVDLPGKLKIGVAAVNTSTTAFTAQLEKFEVFVKDKSGDQ